MPKTKIRREVRAWTVFIGDGVAEEHRNRCGKKQETVDSVFHRRALAVCAPEFMNENDTLPYLLMVGWQIVKGSDWPNGLNGPVGETQAIAAFDAVSNNQLDFTQLEEPLLRRGWILVYLYPAVCCDSGENNSCTAHANSVDWQFANSTQASDKPQFYPDFARYGSEEKPSVDWAYLKALFDVEGKDSILYQLQQLLPKSGANGQLSRGFEWDDYMQGASTCGFSSCATMVSRILEEQRSMAKQKKPAMQIPPVYAAIIDAGGTYLCYNTPQSTSSWPAICGTSKERGTDCPRSGIRGGRTDLSESPFLTHCEAYARYSMNPRSKAQTKGCGSTHLGFSCPALVTEETWMSEPAAEWSQCHAKVLLQNLAIEAWSDPWGPYFYAWTLHSRGVKTAVIQCPSDTEGHGALWYCKQPAKSAVICIDVYWLDNWGRSEKYRDSRKAESERELAFIEQVQYFPLGSCEDDASPGVRSVECKDSQGSVYETAESCGAAGCCWADVDGATQPRCTLRVRPYNPKLSLPTGVNSHTCLLANAN